MEADELVVDMGWEVGMVCQVVDGESQLLECWVDGLFVLCMLFVAVMEVHGDILGCVVWLY